MNRRIIATCAAIALSLAVVSCSEDDEASLDVVVSEWLVDPAEATIPAGETNVVVDNQGGEDHELLVVRGSQADLPIDEETGAVDENALEASGNLLGEIEDITARSEKEKVFDLATAGTYTLLCNIVDEEEDGTIESHYAEGMVAEITVTE